MPKAIFRCLLVNTCHWCVSRRYFNEYRFAGLADGSVIMFFKNSSECPSFYFNVATV